MDWEIGELKQIKGEWYQCVKGDCCRNCDFYDKFKDDICFSINNCSLSHRSDKTSVIFKKLEKVEGTYAHNSIIVQKYRIRTAPVIMPNEPYMYFNAINNTIEIEIKQNKEDMEENKLNLKPFDIQKAREGKPVCTRDGRKARIICFDTKGDPCPIIALVEENGIEAAYHYDKNGQNAYNKSELDLMMLPEKKEGWANIVRGSDGKSHMGRGIFQSKEEAEDAIKAFNDNLIDTIKVSWEE